MAWAHRTSAQEWAIVGLSSRHTQREIAALVGVSAWTVHDVQRKYHVVLRFGRHHAAARRYAWDQYAWGRVLEELYVAQRLTVHETARRCGADDGAALRRLDALGIRRRTTGEAATGTRRGSYRWRPDLPRCPCGTGIAKAGEATCARCKRSARRRARHGVDG